MTAAVIVAAVLAVSVVIGWVGLIVRQRRRPVRGWRLGLLLAAQPVLAMLLWLTLFPPERADAGGVLVVATAGASRLGTLAAGDRLVALPEAGTIGGEQAPDLATALRRHAGVRTVRIAGSGLEARDSDVASGVSVRFDAAAEPRGLVRLDPPGPVAPGALFQVGAATRGLAGGSVELVDPAGRIVDAARLGDGDAVLAGAARGAGGALFTLRLRDAARRLVDTAVVPVWTEAPPAMRLAILAGAPGPEVKYLRRWATDAGLAVTVRTSLGGGIAMGDGAAPTPATLARTDMLLVDDRAWATLSAGERAAIGAAVRGGMGVLLRVTGPIPDAVRASWRSFGFALSGGQATAAAPMVRAAPDDDALRARRGPGTAGNPASIAGGRDEMPALTRRVVTIGGQGVVPGMRDATGAILTAWRAVGQGRVGVSLLEDSFALVTAGQGDRHAECWGSLIGTLARAQPGSPATVKAPGYVGTRLAICGVPGQARIVAPDGRISPLSPDPTAGAPACAGYWPAVAGWHMLAAGNRRTPFYVHPADAVPTVRAEERRATTLLLVGDRTAATAAGAVAPGSPWPWFAGWLALAMACWWFERSGRRGSSAVTGHVRAT